MKLSHLDGLAALLAGDLPPKVDWMAMLALANQALVTPQVYAAALRTGAIHRMPQEVQTFLAEAWRRNRARNRRLFVQLRDAISALNCAGVEPLIFKGGGYWASAGRPPDHDRILNDLDLIVAPDEEDAALCALEAAGFHLLKRYPRDSHWMAEFGRPEDVGLIDLHRRPPGPEDLARRAMALSGQTLAIEWDGLRAKAPSPALQIFLMVLHDQFQDGGYWRGEFPLRHLLEIAELTRRSEGVDWPLLAKLAPTRLVRNALDAELLAAGRMCGALTPRSARRLWIRFQHGRRRAQFGWPRLSPALRALAA
jgi:hypothetical protein